MGCEEAASVPAHLRRFVVRQNYAEYTEEDQAIWRFVVLQTHARLLETAHPSYERGFDAAGISVNRIPRIAEMSERLARFGLRAVSVDGFIPPRAFQAFQARGFLPIAADIRTAAHLTYTPAPDIIHEAAGHAPLLVEPDFARYVQRIGEVAEGAFSCPEDDDVYGAIHLLSELKEDPSATPEQIRRAEELLARAKARVATPSEAARVARLYWWTAEYGLVGTPSDYRLYGAGLLSSIGEGHFCRHTSVAKRPLTARATEVDYDITRAQPELFVVRSFADLHDVLDDVAAGLAQRMPGTRALGIAQASGEVATLALSSGAEVAGVVTGVHVEGDVPALVELAGPCRAAVGGVVIEDFPAASRGFVPFGATRDGRSLDAFTPEALAARTSDRGVLELPLASGFLIRGRAGPLTVRDGRVVAVLLHGVEVHRGAARVLVVDGPCPLALGEGMTSVRAGAPLGYHPSTEIRAETVPKPRRRDPAGRELVHLYERAVGAWVELAGREVVVEFERIARRLDEAFPDAWLLRWNLLESLVKMGESGPLAGKLERDLERLEVRFDRLEPIATGLGYLRRLVADAPAPRAVGSGQGDA